MEGRCTRAGGSFFNAVSEGADAYVMKSIVHDWDDEDALRILRNIRAAIESDGTLLLVEFVLPERPSAHVGLMFDVEMLVNLGGRERTRADFERPAVAGRLPPVAGDRHREPVVDRRGLADLAISA